MLGNGQGYSFTSMDFTHFHSPYKLRTNLTFKNLLLVHGITNNLIYVGQFAKDNNVLFEFRADECLVISKANSKILLQGYLGKDSLYSFGTLQETIVSPPPCVNSITSDSPNNFQLHTNLLGTPT